MELLGSCFAVDILHLSLLGTCDLVMELFLNFSLLQRSSDFKTMINTHKYAVEFH